MTQPGDPGQRPRRAATMKGVTHMRTVATILGIAAAIGVLGLQQSVRADDLNDYPTTARVDFVFGCMKANGETRQVLEQCSCSIDVIATILPYERYVTAA